MNDVAIASSEGIAQRTKNFAASLVFVLVAFLIYHFAPYVENLRSVRSPRLGLSGVEVLGGGCVLYSVLLCAFYFTEAAPRESKSVCALRALACVLMHPARTFSEGLAGHDRLGLLTMAVKVFFAPLMALSLFGLATDIAANGTYLATNLSAIQMDFLATFNSHGFRFLFDAIVFLDVLAFTIGYLVEHPALKNEIRSVDPTWLGWAVTMVCYPPLNNLTAYVLGGGVDEFPKFNEPALHLTVNFAILILMAVYTSASVALNFKGSNLTHRGIVCRGPYRFVRHPAYAAKNMAWWLGTLPAIGVAWGHSIWSTLLVLGSSAAWTAVYMLRALTEEDHLKGVDGEYAAYCEKVRYRFIPGVF